MPQPKLPVFNWPQHHNLSTRVGWVAYEGDHLPMRLSLLAASEKFLQQKKHSDTIAKLEASEMLAILCHDCQVAAMKPETVVSDLLRGNFRKWLSEFPDFTLELLAYLRAAVNGGHADKYRAMAALRTKSDDIKTVARLERLSVDTVEAARRELAKLDRSLFLTKAKKRK